MSKISIAKVISRMFQKRGPEILTGLGIVGMISTVVLAVRATPKALEIIDDCEYSDDEPNKKEIFKLCWKVYLPAAITGGLSVACLIGSNAASARRSALMATAYTLSEKALSELKTTFDETLSTEQKDEIIGKITDKKMEEAILPKEFETIDENGLVLCFDSMSGRYFKSNLDKLRLVEASLKAQLREEREVLLNDYFYAIGLEEINIGNYLVWSDELINSEIDMRFESRISPNGVPTIVVEFRNNPVSSLII